MKKILLFLLLLVTSFSLFGCRGNAHDISEYFLELEYKEDFRILQISDTHLGVKEDLDKQFGFLGNLIDKANADLLIINGDIFTFASQDTAKALFSFLDSKKIVWTVTFGNHDEQCYFSIDWLTNYLNKLNDSSTSYCIFKDISDDDIFGHSNFVINLTSGGKVKDQIIIIDSNRYNYGEYTYYDYIHLDQIEWYKNVVNYSKIQNGGEIVRSVMYFHIPFPEFSDAYDEAKNGNATLILGEKREDVCSPRINTNLFSVIKELGSTVAVNCAHDHINDYIINYKGIYLAYGVKSANNIYYDEELLGGLILTLQESDIHYEQIFCSYDEVE